MDYYNAKPDQIDQDTVWAIIFGEGGLSDEGLMGDWWYGGEQYDLNVYDSEYDESLKENQRAIAIYALDPDGMALYDIPVRQFTIDLYKEQRQ